MIDVSSVPPWIPMPSSSAGDAPPWSGGTPGCARNVISPWEADLTIGDPDQRRVAAVAVEEHQLARRGRGHAPADVVEHGEQGGGRQPDRAGRPGVLVGLRVRQRRQEPHVELGADAVDGRGDHPVGDHQVGVERQVRPVLFDGAERLDEDARRRDQPLDVGSAEIGQATR
jgi:hypothetical protein